MRVTPQFSTVEEAYSFYKPGFYARKADGRKTIFWSCTENCSREEIDSLTDKLDAGIWNVEIERQNGILRIVKSKKLEKYEDYLNNWRMQ